MKKIKLLIVALLSFVISQAQNLQTRYDTCQYLSQYEGAWMFATTTDTVKIFLRANRNQFKNHVVDELLGWQQFIHNGVVMMSDYGNRFMPLPYDITSIPDSLYPSISLRSTDCFLNNYILEGGIDDKLQANERHNVNTQMWSGNNNTYMLWKQSFREFHGVWTGAYGMTLPEEFILVKQ